MPLSRRIVALMFFLLAVVGASPAHAQEDAQYRRIELVDGRTLIGEVIANDDTGMLIEERKGQVHIPWMDIINLEEISEEEFLEEVTRRMVYVGTWVLEASLQEDGLLIARRFEDAVKDAPKISLVSEQELDAMLSSDDENRLAACDPGNADCIEPLISSPNTDSYLYGVVEPMKGRLKITFHQVSLGSGLKEGSVPLGASADVPISTLQLYEATWRLLGLDIESIPDVSDELLNVAVEESKAGNPVVEVEKTPEVEAPVVVPLAPPVVSYGKKGQFLPFPGAPGLYSENHKAVLVSTGAVAMFTGAAVFATGGVGLSVPWTVDEAGWKNPLFLTGVGTVTYVLTSLISNQIVLRVATPNPHAHVTIEPNAAGIAIRF